MKDVNFSNGTVPAVDGTVIDQTWLNAQNDEVRQVAEAWLSSPTLDGSDNAQMLAAIKSAGSGRENMLDNADFKVSQRGSVFAAVDNTPQMVIDRWTVATSAALPTLDTTVFSLSGDPENDIFGSSTNGQSGLLMRQNNDGDGTGESFVLSQRMENPGRLFPDFGPRPTVTFSADLLMTDNFVGEAVTVGIKLYYYDGASEEQVYSGTLGTLTGSPDLEPSFVNLAHTFTPSDPVLDVLGNATEYMRLELTFNMTDGTGYAWFYATAMDFKIGAGSTAFRSEPWGADLARCQRYFERSWPAFDTRLSSAANNLDIAIPGTDVGLGYGFGIEQVDVWLMDTRFKSEKRFTPSVVWYTEDGLINKIQQFGTGGSVWNDAALHATTPAANQSRVATGHPVMAAALSGGTYYFRGHWTADAEFI